MINDQTNLTPLSQRELITQDSPHSPPQLEDLNNIIEEIDIGKSPNKRKAPTPLNDTKNQDNPQDVVNDTTSDSAGKIVIEPPLERRD